VDNTIIKAGKSVENIVVENVKLQKIQDSNMVVTFHEKNRNKNKKKKKDNNDRSEDDDLL